VRSSWRRNAEELHAQIVADYCAAIENDEDAVMITQRRVDARELNARTRANLDARGRLGPERIELPGGEFAAGDLVVLKRNDRRLDVENGSVTSSRAKSWAQPLKQA
jgi:ATP-dependent exoDNAse (exonuclease V) alpha subunit